MVRHCEQSHGESEETKCGKLERQRRSFRPAHLDADRAARVTVSQVNGETQHEPTDEAPPRVGSEVIHEKNTRRGAEQRHQEIAKRHAERAWPRWVFASKNRDTDADEQEREQRPNVCQIEHRFNVRSEEHTSELQSRLHLVCRLLLEKKKKN